MAGITAEGFVKKTLAEIKAEFEASYRAAFGNSINLVAPSLMATTIGIAAEREALVWDVAEEAWNARTPSSAQGVSLDNDGDLTANERLPAKKSTIESQLLFGDVGTVVPTTAVFSVLGNTLAKFKPDNVTTLVAGTDAVQLLSFSAVPTSGNWTISIGALTTSSLAFNASAAVVQAALQSLEGFEDVTVSGNYTAGFTVMFTEASGYQPQALVTTTDTLLATATPITITVTDVTLGVAQGTVSMTALEVGPTVAQTGTLTVIDTPITGLNRVVNTTDELLGRYVESDADYRIRRQDEIQKGGRGTVEAIRAKLKTVEDVLEAIVFENTTLVTDGDGLPGKSVRAYVDGGENQAIGDELWLAVGGGIATSGDIDISVVDSEGLTQHMFFSRPTEKPVYVTLDVEIDPDTFPDGGEEALKEAVVSYGNTLKIGADVLVYPKLLPAIADAVAGLIDISIKVGFSASPTLDDNLTIATQERAKFDTARVVVNFI